MYNIYSYIRLPEVHSLLTSQMELRSYHSESCSHAHDFAQLVLPIQGSMEIEISNHCNLVNDNTAVYIPAQTNHCFSGSQKNLFLVIDIAAHEDFLDKLALPPSIHVRPSAKQFVHFAEHYLSHQDRDWYTDSLVNQLLLHLSSSLSSSQAASHKIIKAKQWIDIHFSAPIDVERVACHCHLSNSQLQRRFRQETGTSIAAYWRMKKMQHAKTLLSKGQVSIEEIAFEIGYENAAGFSRRFSQVFGMPPSEWRNRHCER